MFNATCRPFYVWTNCNIYNFTVEHGMTHLIVTTILVARNMWRISVYEHVKMYFLKTNEYYNDCVNVVESDVGPSDVESCLAFLGGRVSRTRALTLGARPNWYKFIKEEYFYSQNWFKLNIWFYIVQHRNVKSNLIKYKSKRATNFC